LCLSVFVCNLFFGSAGRTKSVRPYIEISIRQLSVTFNKSDGNFNSLQMLPLRLWCLSALFFSCNFLFRTDGRPYIEI
jgi:hypothetical protein